MFDVIGLLLQEGLFFLGYVTGRSEFPKQLPRAEEEALVRRMAEGDDNARQVLITHNLRLVSHIARKYTVPGHGQDDLISIGVIGLIKAVNSYKPGSGTALGTYAARCIENEILMTLRASRKYRATSPSRTAWAPTARATTSPTWTSWAPTRTTWRTPSSAG